MLVVSIQESPLKPHLAFGRPYKRVESSNAAMDQSEYHLLLGSKRNGAGADSEVCRDAVLEDLNPAKVERFISFANERRSLNIPIFADLTQSLGSLELLQGGLPTKGAMLLFGKNPTRFIPNAEFRAAHFSDASRSSFLEQRVFQGDLFEQLEGLLGFVKERLASRLETTRVGDRHTGVLPLWTAQELIANALAHRDYRDPSPSYLNIIGQQELEIMNPGMLPAPKITPQTIHLPHPSVPVNRRVARAFFLAGLIEQWGEGTRRAWRYFADRHLPVPVWESERGVVRVIVRLPERPAALPASGY